MTEQEMADNGQGPGSQWEGATSRWIRLEPCNLAQRECTNTVRGLAEKVKDMVTAECPESEGVGRGEARMGLI